MAYDWRYFSSYRLNQEELERYLTRKFGDWNFYIQVSVTYCSSDATMTEGIGQLTGGERYKFWIERDLTQVRLCNSCCAWLS